jgi:hypothetical protein
VSEKLRLLLAKIQWKQKREWEDVDFVTAALTWAEYHNKKMGSQTLTVCVNKLKRCQCCVEPFTGSVVTSL